MKVAIVHDWLVTDAGAEKVLKSILEIYPNADIYSLVDFLSDKDRYEVLNGQSATTTFIQNLPFAKKYFRNYLPLFTTAIETFDLSRYDLILSSSWAVAKGVKSTSNQIHISYCHTPVRYAWDLYDEYTSSLTGVKKLLVLWSLNRLRKWDFNTLNRVDFFIANSKFVSERIKRTYKRKSTVIYPPVNTKKFILQETKEDFYLSASRLVSYKKTKLIVEAFNEMPKKKLIVIGMGEEYDSIRKIANSNIEILGYQDTKLLISYMQRAKAFVYAAVEDFGIVPIEAMACGTPVIALNKGGTAETVIDGINGVHFAEQTIESIIQAVLKFDTLSFQAKNIAKYAEVFSTDRFKKEMINFISSKLEKI